MEIAVHFVRSPPADEADAIGVNAAAKHGHGPACSGRAGGNIPGSKIGERGGKESNSATEESGDIGGKDELPGCLGSRAKRVDRRGRESTGETKVEESASERGDGTERRVAASAMAQSLAADTILLSGEGNRYEGGCQEVVSGTGQGVEAPLSDPDANVLEPEEIICGGSGGTAVLPWA